MKRYVVELLVDDTNLGLEQSSKEHTERLFMYHLDSGNITSDNTNIISILEANDKEE